MVNKENALNKIEQIKNYTTNIKASVFRGRTENIQDMFKEFEELILDLETMISTETGDNYTRPYRGL